MRSPKSRMVLGWSFLPCGSLKWWLVHLKVWHQPLLTFVKALLHLFNQSQADLQLSVRLFHQSEASSQLNSNLRRTKVWSRALPLPKCKPQLVGCIFNRSQADLQLSGRLYLLNSTQVKGGQKLGVWLDWWCYQSVSLSTLICNLFARVALLASLLLFSLLYHLPDCPLPCPAIVTSLPS